MKGMKQENNDDAQSPGLSDGVDSVTFHQKNMYWKGRSFEFSTEHFFICAVLGHVASYYVCCTRAQGMDFWEKNHSHKYKCAISQGICKLRKSRK